MPLRLLIAAVLLIAALGLGGVAYKAVNPSAPGATAAPAGPVRLLVAAQPLQAGTLLKDTDLREREVPAADMPEGAFVVNERFARRDPRRHAPPLPRCRWRGAAPRCAAAA